MSNRKETLTSHSGIPRRQFLTALAGGAVAAAAAYAASRPTLARLGVDVPFPDFTADEPKTAEGVIDQINRDFAIEVPKAADLQYKVDTRLGNYANILEDSLNTKLNLDEAQILHQTLGRVPAADYLVQLIIPYRFAGHKVFAGGTYEGYFWPVGKGPRLNESLPDIIENQRPATHKFATDKAAFELKLPSGVLMETPLPQKETADIPLPGLSQVTNSQVKINLYEEVPWTTHGERLKQAVVHEFGHALLDQVSIAKAMDFPDYCANPQDLATRNRCQVETSINVKEYYESLGISLINGETADYSHPLIQSFARVNGWQVGTFSQLLHEFSPDSSLIKEYEQKENAGDIRWYWIRDHKVWGNIDHRQPRLTTYASYGPIQEAFCEFWMASILYPQFLTDKEHRYFAKIHQGLKKDPERFIQQIVQNPQILIYFDTFQSVSHRG